METAVKPKVSYRHLGIEERAQIQCQLKLGHSVRSIARELGRAPSSISRELKRCGWRGVATPWLGRGANGYWCESAHKRAAELARKPRVKPKLVPGNPLITAVLPLMRLGMSPLAVSMTLAGRRPALQVSHETIYQFIYGLPRGDERAGLIKLLPRSRKSRRPRSPTQDCRGRIQDMTSIDERPAHILERREIGNFEGDLIKGAFNKSQIGTLVERVTRYVALVAVPRATAQITAECFIAVFKRIPRKHRLSMTYDQGREMAHHAHLARQTGIQVYFAHPHSPWERGSNENANGLLRRYFPKGTDLSGFSQAQLDEIAMDLNARPRKCLGGKCPAELFLPPGTFDFNAYWTARLTTVALGT